MQPENSAVTLDGLLNYAGAETHSVAAPAKAKWARWMALAASGEVVDAKVVGMAKHGAIVFIDGMECYLSQSQTHLPRLSGFVGKSIPVTVLAVKCRVRNGRELRSVYVSHIAALDKLWKERYFSVKPGTKVRGTVVRIAHERGIADGAAPQEIGVKLLVDGILPGWIHWTNTGLHRNASLAEAFPIGKEVEALVIMNRPNQRIFRLSTREFILAEKSAQMQVGDRLSARVSGIRVDQKSEDKCEIGVCLELENGLESYVPRHKLLSSPLIRLSDLLPVGTTALVDVVRFIQSGRPRVAVKIDWKTRSNRPAPRALGAIQTDVE
ncbi:MAG TPA: hypothetical protein V6C81_11830 [Planktothrix sp.]|jgi:ribosomal protein S1